MSHCNGQSCDINSHGHGSHGSCGCSCSSCSESKKCGCGCGCENCQCGKKECDFSHELLQLADDAWMDLLYEKIKAKIEESCGKDLNELATIVSSSNKARWANKLQSKGACKNYEEQIAKFFDKKNC